MGPSYEAACAGVKRSRTFALVNPALESGALLLLVGLLLGPGLGVLDAATLRALSPVVAFGIGWIGADFGSRLDWRLVRRIPRRTWVGTAAQAAATLVVTGLVAWLLARAVPALAAAWQPARPALLLLAAAALVASAGARTAGLLDTLFGAGVFALALAVYHPRATFPGGFGWMGWLAVAGGASGGVGLLFLWLSRLGVDLAGVIGVILVGVGVGYAVEVSPFIVCALAIAVYLHRSPSSRRSLQAVLHEWERAVYALVLVLVGASVQRPTVWVVPAALVLGIACLAARWAATRVALPRLSLPVPQRLGHAGLGTTVAQGAAALALGLSFGLVYPAAGAVLTTVLCAVLAQAVVPPLRALAFRPARGEVTA
jgi:hypothetical protein